MWLTLIYAKPGSLKGIAVNHEDSYVFGENSSVVFKSSCPEKNDIWKSASNLNFSQLAVPWMGEGREGRSYHIIYLPSPCFPISGFEGAWFMPGLHGVPSWCWLWAACISPVRASAALSVPVPGTGFSTLQSNLRAFLFPKKWAHWSIHALAWSKQDLEAVKCFLFAKVRRHSCQEATVLSPSRGAGGMETSALSP